MKRPAINFNQSKAHFFIACSFVLFLLMNTVPSARAQEMFGAVNSNFSGTTSLQFTPTTFVDNRLNLDITLIGGGFSLDNDYVYYPKGKASFSFSDMFDDNGTRKYTDL